ncbi:MAG: M24 family metallopeptidase [Microthrixaceae bacterium]
MPAGLMERASGGVIAEVPNLDRMRTGRIERVRAEMRSQGLDALVLMAGSSLTGKGVAGASTAERPGTDSLTPMFARLLPMAFPEATIVDGGAPMRRARRTKPSEEVAEIAESVDVARRCVGAALAEVVPGVTERHLTGAFMAEMARCGVTTPSNQDVAWVTSPAEPWRRADRDTELTEGDLVALCGGVVRGGYSGEVGQPVAVGGGHGALLERRVRTGDTHRNRREHREAPMTSGSCLPSGSFLPSGSCMTGASL